MSPSLTLIIVENIPRLYWSFDDICFSPSHFHLLFPNNLNSPHLHYLFPLSRFTTFTLSPIYLSPLFIWLNVMITYSLVLTRFVNTIPVWLALIAWLLIFFFCIKCYIRTDKIRVIVQPYRSFVFFLITVQINNYVKFYIYTYRMLILYNQWKL